MPEIILPAEADHCVYCGGVLRLPPNCCESARIEYANDPESQVDLMIPVTGDSEIEQQRNIDVVVAFARSLTSARLYRRAMERWYETRDDHHRKRANKLGDRLETLLKRNVFISPDRRSR